MFDARIRPWIDPPLNAAGRWLAACGVRANAVTLAGLCVGLLAAAAVALREFPAAFALIALSRILDGLDGAVARATAATDRGGYLDIVSDYAFYAAVPFGFALADPAHNALPATALLTSFTLTCASFLAFAAIAAKRGLETTASGPKSFFYSFGLMEGTETILVLLAMTVFPNKFATLAWLFSALCLGTVLQRSLQALNRFR